MRPDVNILWPVVYVRTIQLCTAMPTVPKFFHLLHFFSYYYTITAVYLNLMSCLNCFSLLYQRSNTSVHVSCIPSTISVSHPPWSSVCPEFPSNMAVLPEKSPVSCSTRLHASLFPCFPNDFCSITAHWLLHLLTFQPNFFTFTHSFAYSHLCLCTSLAVPLLLIYSQLV